ncbi:TPR domain/sulfotransferase domain protein [mine drainage metagenome]|uniref:TPR domain/sulfotransferase domain protein n=1 Tax=mine drainage metagenome TaxID=410659 RepID=T1BSP5_9ZZZZ
MKQTAVESNPPDVVKANVIALVDAFERDVQIDHSSGPLVRLMTRLARHSQHDMEMCALALVQKQWPNAALAVLDVVESRYGSACSIDYHRAGAMRALGKLDESDALAKCALAADPTNLEAAIFLASNYRERGQLRAAAVVLHDYCQGAIARNETDNLLAALRFLSESVEIDIAAELCEAAIHSGLDDPRLIAESGKLALQLGEFELACARYKDILARMDRPHEMFSAQAISQTKKFTDPDDPDAALVFSALGAPGLSPTARASALFGCAKIYDDLGNFQAAAAALREANQIIHAERGWDEGEWSARVGRALQPELPRNEQGIDLNFVPIFIVGMPRSGTTLTAELLQKHPQVRSRGELNFMRQLDGYALSAPSQSRQDAVRHSAEIYATHLLRDDERFCFYIDKNPMNFLLLDLIFASFPSAKVICCTRSKGDVALSLWFQFFTSPLTNFCYSFVTLNRL